MITVDLLLLLAALCFLAALALYLFDAWSVVVVWEGAVYRHHAKSFGDAVEWIKQYPKDVSFGIFWHNNCEVYDVENRYA